MSSNEIFPIIATFLIACLMFYSVYAIYKHQNEAMKKLKN